MKIAIGCDHAGIILKDTVMECVRAMGHEPVFRWPTSFSGHWCGNISTHYS